MRLLVANRGEIAVRIFRAAADLGIETVAIHSEDDARSPYLRFADEVFSLEGRGAAAYLDAGQIVAVAKQASASAIHPGYGFLSESAEFARLCAVQDICFIGPSADTLEALGDKGRARELSRQCDIPILGGTEGPTSLEQARDVLASLGTGGAVMVKAISGGGGRGMRPASTMQELKEAWARCSSESQRAFGSGDLYVERLIPRARHIEVQVIGDGQGQVSHLWERECTIQRRFQKVVEIAPSPWISNKTRDRLLKYALRLSRKLNYQSLGTIEFLVDADNEDNVAFIEANPRLQVEHTITEEVTGHDLVAAQLRIAQGETLADLGMGPDRILAPRGFAIQLRVNMETMSHDGTPIAGSGTIARLDFPTGRGNRIDTFATSGLRVTPGFDSLLAKIICHSPYSEFSRAVDKARRALAELKVSGVPTNAAFLAALLARPEMVSGEITTRFIEEHLEALLRELQNQPQQEHYEGVSPAKFRDSEEQEKVEGVAVRASMPGTIVLVAVQEGQPISSGQELCIMDSMKMEHVISSPVNGTVGKVAIVIGDVCDQGQLLFAILPADVEIISG